MKITHHSKITSADYITDKYGRQVFAPAPSGGDGVNYISYYTGLGYAGPDEISKDAKQRGFSKMYWGSDEAYGFKGMYNGDTYVAYNDASQLPEAYMNDAMYAEDHGQVIYTSTQIDANTTYKYSYGMDVGDAESGPIIEQDAFLLDANSLDEAEMLGHQRAIEECGDSFAGGYAEEASEEDIAYQSVDDDVTGATAEEIQKAMEEYQKKQEKLGKQLDDLQQGQLKKFFKGMKKFGKATATAAECHRVGEDDNSIQYIVSDESIDKTKWMGTYLTIDGKIKYIYFTPQSSDWDEVFDEFESIIPEPYQSCKLQGTAPIGIEKDSKYTYVQSASLARNNVNEIAEAVSQAAHKWLVEKGGFDEEATDKYSILADDMYIVEVKKDRDADVIEIRAELSYDSMDNMIDNALDPVVRKYDKSAYFEMEDPGIAVCYLFNDINSSTQVEDVVAADIDDLRDAYLEPEDGPELERLDDVEQEIIIDFDVDITIAEDGSYDYESLDFAKSEDGRKGNYYVELEDMSEEILLRDYVSAVEDMDDLLMYMIPDADPGVHHISGEAILIYKVSGLAIDENGVYDLDRRVVYDRNASEIKDFKFDDKHVN